MMSFPIVLKPSRVPFTAYIVWSQSALSVSSSEEGSENADLEEALEGRLEVVVVCECMSELVRTWQVQEGE